ncbi:MAG: hypothetical protein WC683_16105 [bacterium]
MTRTQRDRWQESLRAIEREREVMAHELELAWLQHQRDMRETGSRLLTGPIHNPAAGITGRRNP